MRAQFLVRSRGAKKPELAKLFCENGVVPTMSTRCLCSTLFRLLSHIVAVVPLAGRKLGGGGRQRAVFQQL